MKESRYKVTEIGKIPQEWEVRNLQECCELIVDYRGKTPKKLGSDWSITGIRALSARNVKAGCIVNEDTIRCVGDDLYRKWMKDEIKREDILLTSEGPMGESMLWDSDEKIVLSQRLFGIRAKKTTIYPKYLYAYISSPHFKDELVSRGTGTTVEGIRQSELIKTRVAVPLLKEQKLIGDLLYQLNKKIELNQQMNKTLEALGQALFKHWFVDFEFPNDKGKPYKSSGGKMVESELGEIPEGWTISKLADNGGFKNGINYLRDEGGDTDFFIANVRDIANNKLLLKDSLDKIKLNLSKTRDYLLQEKDILIARSASPGEISLVLGNLEKVIYSGFSIRYRLNNPNNYLYVFHIMQGLKSDLQNYSIGTTLQSVNQETLKNMKFILPSDKILKGFNKISEEILNKILNNLLQNKELTQIRDSLLPRLMSGRIRVGVD